LLSPLERGRLGADVDPLDAGRHVVEDGRLPQRLDQPRVGTAPLVARNVEAARLPRHVGDDGVEIGDFALIGHRAESMDARNSGKAG
jgi:hypothetical protein